MPAAYAYILTHFMTMHTQNTSKHYRHAVIPYLHISLFRDIFRIEYNGVQ